MRPWILALFLAAAAHAQQVLDFKVVGPEVVTDDSEKWYKAKIITDSDVIDVTEFAEWYVTPASLASIDGGALFVGSFESDVAFLVGATIVYENVLWESAMEVHVLVSTVIEQCKLVGESPATSDMLGVALDAGPQRIIAGAPGVVGPGKAVVFDAVTGEKLVTLLAEDGAPGDGFGAAVALDGDLALIGAFRDDDLGDQSGAAYLFDVVTGQQLAKFTAPDGDAGDEFGRAVALRNGLALIGARAADQNGPAAGAAYLFDVNDGAMQLKLAPAPAEFAGEFGWAVALHDDVALVSARSATLDGQVVGAAYLFDVHTGEQIASLQRSDPHPNEMFGHAVSITADLAVVSSPGDNQKGPLSGSVYTFDLESGEQVAKLLAGGAGDMFGVSIDAFDDTLVVGARNDDDEGDNAGAVYLFQLETSDLITKLTPTEVGNLDEFGAAVAVAHGVVAGAAPFDDDVGSNAGAAYLFAYTQPCLPDVNGDGALTVLDFIIFQLSWSAHVSTADCNADGVFNVLDFVCFQQRFEDGCLK